jgi:hypothetical protein
LNGYEMPTSRGLPGGVACGFHKCVSIAKRATGTFGALLGRLVWPCDYRRDEMDIIAYGFAGWFVFFVVALWIAKANRGE